MPASTPDPDLIAGGEFVVEAPSIDAAVADVVARTGQEPDVVDVTTVAKGGIGGFFAKEVVRVRVRLGTAGPTAAEPEGTPSGGIRRDPVEPTERIATARIHGVEAVLAAMTADADARELSFGEVLRRELDDGRDPLEAARAHAGGGLFAAHPRVATPDEASGSDAAGPETAPTPSAGGPAEPLMIDEDAPAVAVDTPRGLDRPAIGSGTAEAPTSAAETVEADAPVVEPTVVEPTATGHDAAETATTAAAPSRQVEEDAAHDTTSDERLPTRRRSRRHGGSDAIGPAWSMPALYRLGLPASLLDRIEVPDDDAPDGTWLAAVARAVAPLCGGLPEGTQALVGPDADLLGQALSIPVTGVGGNPPYGGDVALVVTDQASDQAWVDQVIGDRWRHVVVSDRPARGLVSDDVAAVSWVGSACLPEAIGLALTCGMVLGHGLRAVGSDVVRATPLDVAIGLRDLLPRHEHRRGGSR